MTENETCSKYFFNLEKQRSKNKIWTQIVTENGEIKQGIDAILSEQLKYLSDLFKSEGTNTESGERILSTVDLKISLTAKASLDTYTSQEELSKAILSFKKGKSPDEDGLTAE